MTAPPLLGLADRTKADLSGWPSAARARLARVQEVLDQGEDGAFGTVVMMTLLLVLLYSSASWYTRVPASVLVIAALLHRPLRSSRLVWLGIAAIVAGGLAHDWFILDNHKYLLGYWCLAILCALYTRDRDLALAKSARWLLCLSFLLAVIWKVRSPDFLDGSFFQYALLLDSRFAVFATMFGGASDLVMELNASAHRALLSYDSTLTEVPLVIPPGIVWLSGVMATWALLIEGAVAIGFLLPSSALGRNRHLFLLTFLVTTYLLAPVIGFGWVLAVMGLASCDRQNRHYRPAYVGVFVVLILYRVPWKAFLAGLAG